MRHDHGEHRAHDHHEPAGHAGHGDHAAQFRDRLWISVALSVPVVFYSEMVQMWLGFTPPRFPGSAWVAPVLGTIVFLYGGWPFLRGGFDEVRSRTPGMMSLISLAITVAFGASAATALGVFKLDFWWELALLIDIMLLGHWLEMRALGQASSALDALAALLPDEAERLTTPSRPTPPDGTETGTSPTTPTDGTELVPIGELRAGDVVLIRPGGRVPADGTVVEGTAELDESMLTGESRPVPKASGDRVVAGTVALDSALRVKVDAVGEATALAGIRRLVEQAQYSRSKSQALADRAAALLFYVATAAGALTFVTWLALGDPRQAVERTVTVLVIACPHALGLAIPLVIAISTSLSARNGILIKDRIALERMRTVDVVLFDKTGTLTKGEPEVTGIAAADGDEDALLRTAGAVESDSEHPLARAIVAAARARGEVPRATGFRSLTGRGVQADTGGHTVTIGGPALLRELNLPTPSAPGGRGVSPLGGRGISTPGARGISPLGGPESLGAEIDAWRNRGAAVLHVVVDGRVAGAIALEDAVRPESRAAVQELHRLGKQVIMITGDASQVARAVAEDVGVDDHFAEVLPEDKDAKVAELQGRGLSVAMVGDGVNDAPALARADVGIAIGAGTDVAIESAGVVLAGDDPRAVVGVIRLSRATYRKMLQNLAWATGYNLVAIPLAAGVLAPVGVTLSPAVGAILMSLSTIVVALNAQLLRRVNLRPTPGTP
ncbi:heavy metal translocating P-type ATPase [Sphaerisporangium corydalis]|uniref:Heavy metal translocating P-type ATPase n=1 Tax=Sphaerisporangium corydalis TaxID=1441875 RepID=A0ABV9EAL2_9ACTN|nr:heavy metal translocating P-type ATPase [Sphaerisporangium corydalis]